MYIRAASVGVEEGRGLRPTHTALAEGTANDLSPKIVIVLCVDTSHNRAVPSLEQAKVQKN
jgi:hypothetical protein